MLFPVAFYGPNTAGPLHRPADLRIVGKGGVTPTTVNTNAANYTRVERRSPIVLGGEPVNQIWIAYYGGYLTQNGESNIGNAATFGFALEYDGATYPFVVEDTVSDIYQSVTPGSIKLWGLRSAALGLSEFPENMEAVVRTEGNGTAGFDFAYPTAQYQTGTGMACNGYTSGTSQLLDTGPLTGGTAITSTGLGPHGIFGSWSSTPDISVMVEGDSVTLYKNDSQDNGTTGGGVVTNGLRSVNGRSVPHVKYSVDGFNLYQFVSSKPWWDFLAGCSTHLLANPGGNDMLLMGRTAAQTLTALSTNVGRFKTLAKGSKYVGYMTLQPATTGPFTTLDDQVPYVGSPPVRAAFNDGIDGFAGDGTIDEVLDTGRAVFEATNSRAEKVWPASTTVDGIHPSSPIVNTAASTIITPAVAVWS